MSVLTDDEYVVTAGDLEEIVTEVWRAFLLDEGEPLTQVMARDAAADVVHSSVGVQGAWFGHVVLELSPTAARAAAVTMLGLDDAAPADVADAVGELVNMVGGNVKSVMPAPSTLGLPVVVEGRVSRFSATNSTELCSTVVGWAGEAVRVSVWVSTPQ